MLLIKSFLASLIFYTTIPLPYITNLDFNRIARWCPIVGILIGIILSIIDQLTLLIQVPILLRNTLLILSWVGITGGLHLDGVMDTADGLAVTNPQKRLTVMQDSVTGAFGVMAAILVLWLKWSALAELSQYRGLSLILAAGWGRWGQVVAIAAYPYLKPTGKGAFHKIYLKLPQDVFLGLIVLIGVSFSFQKEILIILSIVTGSAIALLTGGYFYRRLGGQTGDTYGAIVEWTEGIFLGIFTIILANFSD